MAALPFLAMKGEDEETTLKRWLGYAFYVVTVFLLLLNVSGAWIGSHGNIFYTGAIAGAEMFVALALGALIYTRNNLRFGVGVVVFIVGVYITLENGKMAVTHAMSDVFVGTPEELVAQADLADKSATTLEGDETSNKVDGKVSLGALREEMAELKVQQQEMLAQTPEGIRRAQTRLKASGDYTGPIDGIREQLTEAAMELRGEKITSRMAIVQAQIDALTGIAVATVGPVATPAGPVDTASEVKRKDAILLRKHAKEVSERTVWMTILLIGLEGIRSLALWVFLMDGTMKASRLRKSAYENLKLAEINVEIAAVNAKIAALQNPTPVTIPPVVANPPPGLIEPAPPQKLLSEPIAEPVAAIEPVAATPPPIEPTANHSARKGGKNSTFLKAASKAAKGRLLILADRSEAQVMKAAAE